MIGFFDWTEKKLTCYIFDKKGSTYTLSTVRSVPVEDELSESHITSFSDLHLEQVYLSIPVQFLCFRELNFPFSDREKINSTITYELEGILLSSVNDYCIDYIILDSNDSNCHVLSICMEKSKLKEIIGTFSSAGFEPIAITSLDAQLYKDDINKLITPPEVPENVRAEIALKELNNMTINLRKAELAYMGDVEYIKKALRISFALVLILLILIGLKMVVNLSYIKKQNENIQNEMNAIYQKNFPEDVKIVDAYRQFKGNLNSLREKHNILTGIPALEIILKITNIKNRGITLSEFQADTKGIIIRGSAPSFEDVDNLKTSLASVFSEVRVIDSKASPDKKIHFSIIMKEAAHEI
jgi:type II secretory pathway component PulL